MDLETVVNLLLVLAAGAFLIFVRRLGPAESDVPTALMGALLGQARTEATRPVPEPDEPVHWRVELASPRPGRPARIDGRTGPVRHDLGWL